jgi:hypothetical protein
MYSATGLSVRKKLWMVINFVEIATALTPGKNGSLPIG